MSYKKLYDHYQQYSPPVRRNDIRDKLLELTNIPRFAMARVTLDPDRCRGLYLSPQNTQHPIVRQLGGHVIAMCRGLPPEWERFIYVKEMMHAFDNPDEATDSGDDFDRLLTDFGPPTSTDISLQMRSEINCFWMALGVLCPEAVRQRFIGDLEAGRLDQYEISLRLRLPEQYVSQLLEPKFLDRMRILGGDLSG